jgi:hypothetical protein
LIDSILSSFENDRDEGGLNKKWVRSLGSIETFSLNLGEEREKVPQNPLAYRTTRTRSRKWKYSIMIYEMRENARRGCACMSSVELIS